MHVCLPCQIEYRCKRNGVLLVTMDAAPVEAYMADVWECPGCGHQIIPSTPRPGQGAIAFGQEQITRAIEMTDARVIRVWANVAARSKFAAANGQHHPALNTDLVT